MAKELDDLKAGNAALHTAVTDVATTMKDIAAKITGGISPEEVEAVAQDLNTSAAALEEAIAPFKPA